MNRVLNDRSYGFIFGVFTMFTGAAGIIIGAGAAAYFVAIFLTMIFCLMTVNEAAREAGQICIACKGTVVRFPLSQEKRKARRERYGLTPGQYLHFRCEKKVSPAHV